ncbi:hypothetical protein [Helicobacter sp. UBA3407]|nr:hypothetical protein [Helicobacter sp. UBA3407]
MSAQCDSKVRNTLHTGCVVGQNALVTKDVPPFAVVGGIPARILISF